MKCSGLSTSVKVLIGVLSVGLVVSVGALFLKGDSTDSAKSKKYDSSVVIGGDTESINERLQDAQKKVDEGMLGVDITTNPTFPNGTDEGYVLIGNPATNTKDFKVRFVVEDSKEVVYESGLIPPNGKVEKAKLSKPLAKGNYDSIAYFTAYNEDGEPDGEVGLEVTITVEN